MDELRELVMRAQSGDSDAYDIIVERYRAWAVRYANRILNDHQLAEDAVQEAFSEAYGCLEQLREPLAFKSWFRKIIVKRCDRIIRKQNGELIPLDAAIDLPSSEPRPDQVAELQELRAKVDQVIASLPKKEYEVIKRFYFDGQSQRQIGEALGVAEKTVKNRLYNARNRLRTHPTLKKILKEFNAT